MLKMKVTCADWCCYSYQSVSCSSFVLLMVSLNLFIRKASVILRLPFVALGDWCFFFTEVSMCVCVLLYRCTISWWCSLCIIPHTYCRLLHIPHRRSSMLLCCWRGSWLVCIPWCYLWCSSSTEISSEMNWCAPSVWISICIVMLVLSLKWGSLRRHFLDLWSWTSLCGIPTFVFCR